LPLFYRTAKQSTWPHLCINKRPYNLPGHNTTSCRFTNNIHHAYLVSPTDAHAHAIKPRDDTTSLAVTTAMAWPSRVTEGQRRPLL